MGLYWGGTQHSEPTRLVTVLRHLWYGDFRSEEEAKRTTKQWLKEHKVTGEERTQDLEGQVVFSRTIAVPKHGGKGFIVIRRHGLNYWFIQSVSLSGAMQVDGLITLPPPLR
jgi:hypothetical protein